MAEKPLCSVEDCGKPARTRGWCAVHYNQFHRTGRVGGLINRRGQRLVWIAEHVSHQGDECLLWPFSRLPNGYGRVFFEGTYRSAARVMCQKANGAPASPEMETLHSCGNGHLGCMNPRHVRWGTRLENMQDAIAHETTTRGARNSQAVLLEDQVREIRRLAVDTPYAVVADKFSITPSAVGLIVRRERWGWLE